MFTLIKRDVLLAENYVLLAIVLLIAIPCFLSCSVKGVTSPVYNQFIAFDFSAFILFGQIYLIESKYKGATYLMICPYTKLHIIITRYVLLFLLGVLGVGIYKILEIINPGELFGGVERISLSNAVLSMSIVFLIYDVLFPLLNSFAYEKIRVWHTIISVFVPVWGLVLLKYILEYFKVTLQFSGISSIGIICLIVADVVCTVISIRYNLILWKKKEF